MSRRFRRGDESGQALVEFALVLPLIALFVGVSFNGWSGIQQDLRLTSAARAGAIAAANDLAAGSANALQDATNAINAEEGVTAVYQCTSASGNNYVSMATTTPTPGGVTIKVVTISISNVSITLVPVVGDLSVAAHAQARYG